MKITIIVASLLLCFHHNIILSVTPSSSSSSYHHHSILQAPPISLKSGVSKFLSLRWYKAKQVSLLEQYVEDWNADYIATSNSMGQSVKYRRLIALPLDDRFNPPVGVFSHNHIQTGDKVCLPSNFWTAIQVNHAEVPWLFTISRIPGITSERVPLKGGSNNKIKKHEDNKRNQDDSTDEHRDAEDNNENDNDDEFIISPYKSLEELDQVIAGPLDFRAPSNYIFLPLWMMRSLGIRPRDIVDVELIETVPAGSLAKLRPHTNQFAKDVSNPQAVLETELRHYSSLTKGTTIAFDYNQKRYWFDVVELRSSPKGTKETMIKVQDCDIATDFLTPKDKLMEHLKKKKLQQRMKRLEKNEKQSQ